MRQDPFECTISFILSSNNNIQRITQLVRKLRDNFGQLITEEDHAFPTLAELEVATEAKLRELGLGYRAKYIVDSCKTIRQNGGEKWLDSLREIPTDEARENLVKLKGVGRKVADCILLFSMDCPEVIPVDTHVFQIAKRFGWVKGNQTTVTDKLHAEINEAF